jgi:hypothetical protein
MVHRGLGGRHATDGLVDLLHGRRTADDEVVPLLSSDTETLEIVREAAELECPTDQRIDLFEIEGLGQVIVGPTLRGLDGMAHGVLRCHDHEQRIDAFFASAGNDIEAREVRHANVEEGEVEAAGAQRVQGRRSGRDRGHAVAVAATGAFEDPANRLLVVRHQDGSGCRPVNFGLAHDGW